MDIFKNKWESSTLAAAVGLLLTCHSNTLTLSYPYYQRRTLSSVICDNMPVKRKKKAMRLVKINTKAFLLKEVTEISACEDILEKSSLDFKSIAEELVGSFGKNVLKIFQNS